MAGMALWRVQVDGVARLARGPADTGPRALLHPGLDLDGLLSGSAGSLTDALAAATEPVPEGARLLCPLGSQEVWAAGVTYQRSLDARREEADSPDPYDRVYTADRPELFFKAAPGKARGPGDPVAVRADSGWDVPEPELCVVADRAGRIVGFTIGNDVSSRSIEGENPLYLPQAKVYDGSCAVGPCIVPVDEAPDLAAMEIALAVHRDGGAVYEDGVAVADMRRTPSDLVDWLYRAQAFPVGVVLLTGTSIVPDAEFTLSPGDEVVISITGLGMLRNSVERVGSAPPPSAASLR